MPIKRVQVVCPANAITGGPEFLHNLVAAVSSLGVPASIVYFPFSTLWPTPAPYRHYGAEISVLNDAEDTLVIFPENSLHGGVETDKSQSGDLVAVVGFLS